MADETKAADEQAQTRKRALEAWHKAETKEQRAEAVKQFPILRTMFSDVNHS